MSRQLVLQARQRLLAEVPKRDDLKPATNVVVHKFAEAGAKRPQPEVYLRADQNVAYRYIAQTLADASKAGLSKVGFISEPEAAAR